MIQINLVPEVKLELIRAQKHRRVVISVVTIAIIVAISITVLLALYVFMIQNLQISSGKDTIIDKHREFISRPDIQKSVTIANQIANIDTTHENKNMMSRIFDILAVASSKGTDNSVSITTIDVNAEQSTISVTGQTDVKGFEAADVFRKNIEAMQVYYIAMNPDGTYDKSADAESFPLATQVSLSDLSLGRDSTDGQQHVTFKLSLTYDEKLFSPSIHIVRIQGLEKGNVTDSYSRLPLCLFATDDQQTDCESTSDTTEGDQS